MHSLYYFIEIICLYVYERCKFCKLPNLKLWLFLRVPILFSQISVPVHVYKRCKFCKLPNLTLWLFLRVAINYSHEFQLMFTSAQGKRHISVDSTLKLSCTLAGVRCGDVL
jgi:hypothetical protein